MDEARKREGNIVKRTVICALQKGRMCLVWSLSVMLKHKHAEAIALEPYS